MSAAKGVGRGVGAAAWGLGQALRGVGRSLRENLGWALISVVLSTLLWAAVTNEANPTRTDIFSANLPVAVRNIPPGTQLMTQPSTVQVRVSAPQDVWGRLRTSSFAASVDLTGAAPGTVERPVEVDSTDSQARVVEVLPPKLSLRLEALTRKQVPVRLAVSGAVPFGFTSEPAKVMPSQVFVSGPSSLVDQVDSAAVNVAIEGSRVSINQAFSVYAQTAQGTRVSGVTLEPDAVTVAIDIVEQVHYRAIAVQPALRGTPAPGYDVKNVSVDPPVVTVVGDRATLEGINFLRTTPIDLTGARADLQRLAEVDLPRGVNLSGPNSIAVNITIAPQQGTSRLVIAPAVVGLSPDEEATPPPSVEVNLAGDLPTLQTLDPGAVSVTLDATGLRPGTYQIAPKVTVPPGLTLVSANPARVPVTIRPAAPPAPSGGG